MSNYKETNVSGTSYVRCNTVTIASPLNGEKSAYFNEETVTNLGERQISEWSGGFHLLLNADTAATQFPLLNPETGEALGTSMSYQDLYVALYSLYIHGALARDAA